jgi:hypothetical protein
MSKREKEREGGERERKRQCERVGGDFLLWLGRKQNGASIRSDNVFCFLFIQKKK